MACINGLVADPVPILKLRMVSLVRKSLLGRSVIRKTSSCSARTIGRLPDVSTGWPVSNTDSSNNNLGTPIVMFVFDSKLQIVWLLNVAAHFWKHTTRIQTFFCRKYGVLNYTGLLETFPLRYPSYFRRSFTNARHFSSWKNITFSLFSSLPSASSKVMLSACKNVFWFGIIIQFRSRTYGNGLRATNSHYTFLPFQKRHLH